MSINVCILGVSGYTGSKLLYYLNKHKDVNIRGVFGNRQVGRKLKDFFPKFENLPDLKISNYKLFNFKDVDLIFSCLPHGEFQKNIISDLDPNISIIDLSGDFRLKKSLEYFKWYNQKHKAVKKIKKSIYSIPELQNEKLKNYNIISCPGCYPTSILLPLIPLIEKNLIEINRNWHLMWSTFYFYKIHFGITEAYKKTILKFFSAFFKYLIFSILRKKTQKNIYFARMSGIFNAVIGKKSWFRTQLNHSIENK